MFSRGVFRTVCVRQANARCLHSPQTPLKAHQPAVYPAVLKQDTQLETEQSPQSSQSTFKRIKNPQKAFIERLRADGGDKIVTFQRNFLHTEYTRFLALCDQVKGLTIDQALLQIRWLRKPISRKMEAGLKDAIVKAKEEGFDLSKTYIADVYVKQNAAIIQTQLEKKFIKGRGRYGATPHPVTTLWEITLQERDKPFAKVERDPLEWIRVRLRERQKPYVQTAEDIYSEIRDKRVVKEVFC
ncbi:hypothetical protein DFS34DRAFT_612052 [Phlyctochytrium arcticum]|nr:hypothetical protein DFS34DRAFT_612052 [Phlyctochytrium arcticum]